MNRENIKSKMLRRHQEGKMNRQGMFQTLVAMLVDADRTEESYHDLALRICNLFEAPDENAVFWNQKWAEARMEIGSLNRTKDALECELAARDKDVIEAKEDRDRLKLQWTGMKDELKLTQAKLATEIAKADREAGEDNKEFWVMVSQQKRGGLYVTGGLYTREALDTIPTREGNHVADLPIYVPAHLVKPKEPTVSEQFRAWGSLSWGQGMTTELFDKILAALKLLEQHQ